MSTERIAIEYGQRGWAVFPVEPRSKVPACEHGLHDARKDAASILALWRTRTNLNLGIATGAASGFWVLDVDGDDGMASLAGLERQHGKLPATLTSITGKGKHLLFRMPATGRVRSRASKIGRNLDTRGDGGYIVAPPSIHASGTPYRWEAMHAPISHAPAWLMDIVMAEPVRPPQDHLSACNVEAPDADWSVNDVLTMLECIPPDCSHDDWLAVGMALNDAGWPLSIWDNWSRGGTKYQQGETARRWQSFRVGAGISFGSLVHMAQSWGWKPADQPSQPLDLSNIDGIDFREFAATLGRGRAVQAPAPLPEVNAAPAISGLIGDTLQWINSTAFKVQPELTTMNIVAALGAVFGRRYALQKLGTRTNIYMVGIAESGQGKDNSRKRVKKLMTMAGLGQFSGPDEVRSGPGLMMELKQKPSILANIDEIGLFMRALFDPKAPGYQREISSIFTKLYSSSDSEYIGGLLAGKPDDRMTLIEPNLCIYGTTTMGSYAEAMRKSAIASGELNRFVVLKSATDFPEPNFEANSVDPPEHLVTRWAQFAPEGSFARGPDIIVPEKVTVLLGDMAEEVNQLYRVQDEMIKTHQASGMGALWVRYRENVLKVAMIFSIARDHKRPVLTGADIETGKSMVGASIRFMMKFATENMYDSDFEKTCSQFMQILVSAGSMTRSQMNHRLRMKPRDLDTVESTLHEIGRIDINRDGKTKIYRVIEG
ncbi:bifunctional DNA primase/polymerase [Roseicella sp. DB1501]|uniref:bifunctional DNA primase/polymerase n=1 Tax=Roseicella sp. DB1501 TaxID=2730925 RepID=UPI00149323CC|nr:bifunctional DNA primase/polymerase [Roseicella sp. DB1501]NOG73742.1 hypothetical protein [Roseicella sp. DB1501]